MLVALISDLHLDYYTDGTTRFCKDIDVFAATHPADVMVVAGDIADGRFPDQFQKLFAKLREYYAHVIVVTGNHDYHDAGYDRAHRSIEIAAQVNTNIHFLHRSSVTIHGRTFHGHTLWYRDEPGNVNFEHWMPDIGHIPGFKKFVHDEQYLFENYLHGHLQPGDIVVTHHLPHPKSIAPAFARNALNAFFLCDMTDLIEERSPALWLHGHTHVPRDYRVGGTRVVCNPRGYPRERGIEFKPVIISL